MDKSKYKIGVVFIMLLCFLGLNTRCTNTDKNIPWDILPANSKYFINTYLGGYTVQSISEDNNSYDVLFTNGMDVLFYKESGDWAQVAYNKGVPQAIFNWLPQKAQQNINEGYYQWLVTAVGRSKTNFFVTLNNGVKITYDTEGNYIKQENV